MYDTSLLLLYDMTDITMFILILLYFINDYVYMTMYYYIYYDSIVNTITRLVLYMYSTTSSL